MIYVSEIIFYIILGLIEFLLINQLSALGFVCLFYIVPIIFTIFITFYKSDKSKILIKNLTSSTLATISYVILGLIFEHIGAWAKFVKRNTLNMKDSWIHINSNMVDISQVLFILILYFGLGYLIYFIAKKNTKRGK